MKSKLIIIVTILMIILIIIKLVLRKVQFTIGHLCFKLKILNKYKLNNNKKKNLCNIAYKKLKNTIYMVTKENL